jgi:hypothetical protein
MKVMSRSRIGYFVRNCVVAILLSGMLLSVTACPEKGESSSIRDGADNHKPADHMGGGMGMP